MMDALGEEDIQRAHSLLNILFVFEAEIACQNKSWGRILEVIDVSPRLICMTKIPQELTRRLNRKALACKMRI